MKVLRCIWARYELWRSGYCPRHLIQKKRLSEFLMGARKSFASTHEGKNTFLYSDEYMEDRFRLLDCVDHYRTYCEMCTKESTQREKVKLARAIEMLGGKLR